MTGGGAAMAGGGADAWIAQLDAWLSPFLAALPWAEQRRWASLYVRGLLLPGERKSVEPIAKGDPSERCQQS